MQLEARLARLKARARELTQESEAPHRIYVRYVDEDGQGPTVPPAPGEPFREFPGPHATVVYVGDVAQMPGASF